MEKSSINLFIEIISLSLNISYKRRQLNMKKKIICISLVVMFLLMSIGVISISANNIKTNLKKNQIEKQTSNERYIDCPCNNIKDPRPSWAPGCIILWIQALFSYPETPWEIMIEAYERGCWWARNIFP